MKEKIEKFLEKSNIKLMDLALLMDVSRTNIKPMKSSKKNNLLIDTLSFVQRSTGLTGDEFVKFILRIDQKTFDLKQQILDAKKKDDIKQLLSGIVGSINKIEKEIAK